VICPEDSARNKAEDLARGSEGTLFGKHVMWLQTAACGFWPKATIDPKFYEPLKSAIPTLVLSGEIDPITPPVWGDQIAQHLTAAKHIVMPGTGHGVVSTGCGQRIIREFIEKGSADSLDTACVGKMKRPPFFLTPSGPDPGQVAK
jgi:pimeloyl-ACP methyl ester carboxylesterase